MIFGNTKIKTFVPGFEATIQFTEGIKKVLDWFDEDETRRKINPKDDEFVDNLISFYLQSKE